MDGTAEADPNAIDLRAVGERIDALLVASSAYGAVARERTEELVRLVTDVYGAGLERLLEILHAAGRLGPEVLADLADDDLVASLLLVHGLHPYDLPTRVELALRELRPGLRSQGAEISLAAVDADGVVRLSLSGAISGCTTTALRETVGSAVRTGAPDAAEVRIEVVPAPATPSLIPVSALRSRLAPAAR